MAEQRRILFTIYLIGLISGLTGFNIDDCGSKKGKFSKVNVLGCDMSQPSCILHRGTNATISIDFVPSEDAPVVKTVVHGIINGIPVPFPLANPDACVNTGIACPLKAGTAYEYQAILPVQRTYPKITLKVKWQLVDKDGASIICIQLPARLQ